MHFQGLVHFSTFFPKKLPTPPSQAHSKALNCSFTIRQVWVKLKEQRVATGVTLLTLGESCRLAKTEGIDHLTLFCRQAMQDIQIPYTMEKEKLLKIRIVLCNVDVTESMGGDFWKIPLSLTL